MHDLSHLDGAAEPSTRQSWDLAAQDSVPQLLLPRTDHGSSAGPGRSWLTLTRLQDPGLQKHHSKRLRWGSQVVCFCTDHLEFVTLDLFHSLCDRVCESVLDIC